MSLVRCARLGAGHGFPRPREMCIRDSVKGASSSAIIGRDTGRGYMNVGIAENYFRAALNKRLPARNTNQEGTK